MIIGISGRAESGKNLVADFLIQEFDVQFRDCSWQTQSFGATLKWMCAKITNTPYEIFETGKTKKLFPPWDNFTGRTFLQEVGTKMRKVDPDFWIKALSPNLKKNIIITDLRFKNELEWIKSQGGITIRVERFTNGYYYTNGLEVKNNAHISETELDNEEFDFTLINNGTKNDLYDKVVALVESREFRNKLDLVKEIKDDTEEGRFKQYLKENGLTEEEYCLSVADNLDTMQMARGY